VRTEKQRREGTERREQGRLTAQRGRHAADRGARWQQEGGAAARGASTSELPVPGEGEEGEAAARGPSAAAPAGSRREEGAPAKARGGAVGFGRGGRRARAARVPGTGVLRCCGGSFGSREGHGWIEQSYTKRTSGLGLGGIPKCREGTREVSEFFLLFKKSYFRRIHVGYVSDCIREVSVSDTVSNTGT